MSEFEVAVQQLEKRQAVAIQQELKPPARYQVLLLNDDFTPMDFVVGVLITFFAMDKVRATQVMLKIHQEGEAICGVYSRDVAETRVLQVNNHSRNHHPLRCVMRAI